MLMQNNKPLNLTRTNMAIAWLSIFAESWLLLMRKLPIDGISVFFFCFFILVAVGSWMGTVVEERQINPKGESK
jgi:hypothetical protein